MKNLNILIIFLFVFTLSNAQIVNIPDANFKNALVNTNCVDTNGDNNYDDDVDTNNDGEIQVSEAEAILKLNVSNNDIDSLEGIESFSELLFLGCSDNNLVNLDVSQNPVLEALNCSDNQLISLILSQNLNLEYLACEKNQLIDLDISNSLNLQILLCEYNQLVSLNLNQNPSLIYLNCNFNQITNLNLSQSINLEQLYCSDNQLVNLDISQNNNIETLFCYKNQLVNLDISHMSNLNRLSCRENQLTSLNINNGNNSNMDLMWSWSNLSLYCIQVDDETATFPICDLDNYLGWCKDVWAEYSEECELGLDDFTLADFTLYPNPTQVILNIETQEQIETAKIYNLQGQLIKEESSSSIDVSILNTGLYFVQVTVDGQSITKKFIKE